MKITFNGVEQTITNQQLYDLAAKGLIGPNTIVHVNGKPFPAGQAKGIVFGPPQNVTGQAPPANDFALPPQQAALDQQKRMQPTHISHEKNQEIHQRCEERNRLMEERRVPKYSPKSMTQWQVFFYLAPLVVAPIVPGIIGAVVVIITMIAIPFILFYRCWKIIQDRPERISAPLTPVGLAKRMNDYCDYYGIDVDNPIKLTSVGWIFALFVAMMAVAIFMCIKNAEHFGGVSGVASLLGGLLVPFLLFNALYGPFGKKGAKIQESKEV